MASAVPANAGGVNSHQQQQAALKELLDRPSLSDAEFQQQFADILRVCQKAGECPYDWLSMRHLLALRFQNVYSDFVASDAASAPSETAWMCGECKKTIAEASASGPNAAANAIANAHCRRSEVDEESQEVRFQRMMHMLIAFYKPPFTFQRMCDLLLEPRLYCKTTNKFLLAFSKLVYGINCDVLEDNFNVNWLEQKDLSLGVPAVEFVARDEGEFHMSDGSVATHALLPPQHHRVGMNAADIVQAQAKEAEAKRAIQQQQQQQQPTDQQQGEDEATHANANGSDNGSSSTLQQEADDSAPMDSSD